MLAAAAEAAAKAAKDFAATRPLVLGVTVLTSLDRRALETELGVPGSVEAHVLRLAEAARAAGLDGCVASPREIGLLRNALGRAFVLVTPGIRIPGPGGPEMAPRTPQGGDDQVRVATPAAAIAAGADYLVVGRPITAAPDPLAAARAILEDIASAPR